LTLISREEGGERREERGERRVMYLKFN